MKSARARGLVMTLVGFGILLYSGVGYITGDFRVQPSLTLFGLIAVAVGVKLWKNPKAH